MTSPISPLPRLDQRRDRIARAWDASGGVLLVPAGLPLPIAGSDLYHDFHAHPEHVYLAGVQEPGGVLAFDPRDGWSLFAQEATPDDRIWVGDGTALDDLAQQAGLDTVRPASELRAWLDARRGEPITLAGNHDIAHNPEGYGLDGWRALEPDVSEERSARISEVIAEARRTKDEDEIHLMRAAANASIEGHLQGLRLARPGMTERELQIEIEAEFFRNGGDRTAYGSIVGTGPNGAVLHFAPTRRPIAAGDIILVDAGAEHEGYASDVTRTYPAGQRFTPEQRDLYGLVYAVQQQAIADARPGKEYRELHLEAAEAIASGLVDLGILRGDPASLVEQDAHALFFPHGLGHMLGLATHDAGGCLAGRTPSDRFGLRWLRTDLPLQPGYVVTIEPGIYFIPALLDDPARREQFAQAVNWERVDALRGFGGIRIEDDVLITGDGAEVLTAALPSSIAAIEDLRREGHQGATAI